VERALAEWMDTEDAVAFPSGFQLNVGVLPCMLDPSDLAYSDRLNHASLIDGLRLSRARVEIVAHLEPPPISAATWWITESIFSMDGDRVDVAALAAHQSAGGYLYVDEAHALGLFPDGHGLLSGAARPDVLVGTLSKALGCAGAFVAGSSALCDWIRNRARSYVFSTGPTPLSMAAILAAIECVRGPQGDRLRAKLWSNVRALEHGLHLDSSLGSPIVPLFVGPNALAVDLSDRLLERGWHVQAIRPPTVPEGTARLRVTVSAAHSSEQVERLAADLRAEFTASDLPLRLATAS
jgi:8-amino-7-oxononanoate synthase